MSEGLKLSVFSPERRLLVGASVEDLVLPTSEGEIQILIGHANMLGSIETGIISFQAVGEVTRTKASVSSGFFEVTHSRVILSVETLELDREVDLDRAKVAQRIAEEKLKSEALDPENFRKYQLKLQRSLIGRSSAGRSEGRPFGRRNPRPGIS